MKFQPLILPTLLWILTAFLVIVVPPTTSLRIFLFIALVFSSLFFTLRLLIHKPCALTLAGCSAFFLLVTWLFGFNVVNTCLIFALGTLLCQSYK